MISFGRAHSLAARVRTGDRTWQGFCSNANGNLRGIVATFRIQSVAVDLEIAVEKEASSAVSSGFTIGWRPADRHQPDG